MVDDETEPTSEELPPHLREEPPEGTVLALNVNSLQSIEENVLAKKSDLSVWLELVSACFLRGVKLRADSSANLPARGLASS